MIRIRVGFARAWNISVASCTASSIGSAEIETVRADGTRQQFAFARRGEYLESTSDIPEPHEFQLVVAVTDHGVRHAKELQFTEDDHGHGHGGAHGHTHGAVDATLFTSA